MGTHVEERLNGGRVPATISVPTFKNMLPTHCSAVTKERFPSKLCYYCFLMTCSDVNNSGYLETSFVFASVVYLFIRVRYYCV